MIAHGIVDRDKSLPFISAKLTVYNTVAQICDPRSWICRAAVDGQLSGYPVVNAIGGLGGGTSDTVGDCLGIHKLIAESGAELASAGLLRYRCVNCGAFLTSSGPSLATDLIASSPLDHIAVIAVSCKDFLQARFAPDKAQTFNQSVMDLLLLLAVEFVVVENELQRVSKVPERAAKIDSLDLIQVVLFSAKVSSFQSRVSEFFSRAKAAIAEVNSVGAILLVDARSRQVKGQAPLVLEGSCSECGFRADIEKSKVSGVGVSFLGYAVLELAALKLSSLWDRITEVEAGADLGYLAALRSTLERLVQAGCGELTLSKNLSELTLAQVTSIKLVLASEIHLPAGVILLDPLLVFAEQQELTGVSIALERLLKGGWAAISWGNFKRWRNQLGQHIGELLVGDSVLTCDAGSIDVADSKQLLALLDPSKVATLDKIELATNPEQALRRAQQLFNVTQNPELILVDLADPPTEIAKIAQLSIAEIVGLPGEFAALANLTSSGEALVGVTELEMNEITARSASRIFQTLPSLANRIAGLEALGLANLKLAALVSEIPIAAQLGCVLLRAVEEILWPSITDLKRGKRSKLALGSQSVKVVAVNDPFVWLLPHELGYIANVLDMITLAGALVMISDSKITEIIDDSRK